MECYKLRSNIVQLPRYGLRNAPKLKRMVFTWYSRISIFVNTINDYSFSTLLGLYHMLSIISDCIQNEFFEIVPPENDAGCWIFDDILRNDIVSLNGHQSDAVEFVENCKTILPDILCIVYGYYFPWNVPQYGIFEPEI